MTDVPQHQAAAAAMNAPAARVYLDFYQLAEAPFAITPDPDFLFFSGCHRQVLDKIGYAIDGRMGFILLTGEVGTGKTTLCRTLLDQLGGKAHTVYVINPSVSGPELLAGILEDAGIAIEAGATKKALIDRFNQWLLANDVDRPFVVIIDDAQTMTPETLEDLRLLSNLETDKRKLIQVVLSGQPELLDRLDGNRLRQLKQRIAVHCRLQPLCAQETGDYISRRLFVAGNQGQIGFTPAAIRLVHKTAGGIPRLINQICDYALTAGYVQDASTITVPHVQRALAELHDHRFPAFSPGGRVRRAGLSLAAIPVLLAALFFAWPADHFHFQKPARTASEPSNGADIAADLSMGPVSAQHTAPPALSAGNPPPAIENVNAFAVSNGSPPADTGTSLPEHAQKAPFALQLGSYRTMEDAQQDATRFRAKGVPAHWQQVNSGQWYRVVAGKFEDMALAEQYKTDHGLPNALVINAPLSVKVLPKQPDIPDGDICHFLAQMGFDRLMEEGSTGDNAIYTGLFASVADAARVAERINHSDRFLAQVVRR